MAFKNKLSCKLCGSAKVNSFFRGDDRVLKCNSCNVVFLAPNILSGDLEKYYSERFAAEKYVSPERLAFLENNSKELLNIVEKFSSSKRNPALLDIGSNIGVFVKEAIKKGYDAVGIEPSKAMFRYATNLGVPMVSSTIEEFNPEKTFDIITIFHTLEHLANPIEVLSKLKSVHNQNGFLILEVPNIESYMAKKDGISWKFIAYEHIFYFSPETISDILQGLGYKIVSIKRRNNELSIMSIRKLMRYFLGPYLNRNRFVPKAEFVDVYNQFEARKDNLFKTFVRKILISVIKILGRQDHILVVAQKL